MLKTAAVFICLMISIITIDRPGYASEPPVAAASIAPLHALLVQVTQGISNPTVLLRPGASPHAHALRPSEVTRLEQADVIFWIGPALEGVLVNPIRALGPQAVSVALMDMDEVHLLERREGGVDDHDDDPNHEQATDLDSTHADPHIWLDPTVAGMIMHTMADVLSGMDPARKTQYMHNASQGQKALRDLEIDVFAYLEPFRDRPYVVFHDAYQYFEHRFDLAPMAIVSVDPDHPPGARRIAEIRNVLMQNMSACVFVEPQFTPKLMETLREGTSTKTATLDPVGVEDPGLRGYENLIWALARNMGQCLE